MQLFVFHTVDAYYRHGGTKGRQRHHRVAETRVVPQHFRSALDALLFFVNDTESTITGRAESRDTQIAFVVCRRRRVIGAAALLDDNFREATWSPTLQRFGHKVALICFESSALICGSTAFHFYAASVRSAGNFQSGGKVMNARAAAADTMLTNRPVTLTSS